MSEIKDELDVLAEYELDSQKELAYTVAQEKAFSEEREMLLAEAEALTSLRAHAGWKVFNKFLTSQIESYTAKLVTESSFQEIRRIQEYLKALHNLQQWPEIKISEASQFVEQSAQRTTDLE